MSATKLRLVVLAVLLSAAAWILLGQTSGIGSIDVNILKNAVYCADTGSANAIVCSTPQIYTSYVAGQPVLIKLAATVTGATTININGLGSKAVTKNGTTALANNDLLVGGMYWATYDGTELVVNQTLTTAGTGTVTSVAESFTGGLISVGGSPVTSSGTLALTVAGTSGGIPCFNSATTWTSSVALTLNALTKGGGAGACPTNSSITDDATTASLGTAFTVTESTGIPAKVSNITTVGLGVPVLGWQSVLTNSSAVSLVTLATAPGAGDYQIHFILDQHTLCTTGTGAVNLAFGWTGNAARTITTGSMALSTGSQVASGYLSGTLPIHVVSGNVTFTPTIGIACASGTATWDGNIWLERVN